jgi:serine/threonine protein kinase
MESVLRPTSAGARLLRESPAVLLALFREACEAVAHLHRADVLHRDIKPSNVLLMLDPAEPMRAVIADLGIASLEDEQGDLTATHETVGTPLYRAPESIIPGGQTKASDVYSLGKTLQAILSGQAPREMGPRSLPRHASLSETLWHALDGVIARACAHDPSVRYLNAEAFLDALPATVLTLAGSASVAVSQPADPSLSAHAAVVLYELIARCPGESDSVLSSMLARSSRLVEYDFSMGLSELRDRAFLQAMERRDDEGAWNEIRPSESAFLWARRHSDAMEAARPPLVNETESDIPF